MSRILSIVIAALFLTAIAAPSAEAARRRHRTVHHTAKHMTAKHSRMTRSAPAQRDGGSAAVDQLNQQSLNAARGAN